MKLWDTINGEPIGFTNGHEADTCHACCDDGDEDDQPLDYEFTNAEHIRYILDGEYACMVCDQIMKGTRTQPKKCPPVDYESPFL